MNGSDQNYRSYFRADLQENGFPGNKLWMLRNLFSDAVFEKWWSNNND